MPGRPETLTTVKLREFFRAHDPENRGVVETSVLMQLLKRLGYEMPRALQEHLEVGVAAPPSMMDYASFLERLFGEASASAAIVEDTSLGQLDRGQVTTFSSSSNAADDEAWRQRRGCYHRSPSLSGGLGASFGKMLGSGSDGVVYSLKGDAVVKIITDPAKLAQGERELNLHRSLPPHPSIVRCFAGLVVPKQQVTLSLERCDTSLWSAIAGEAASPQQGGGSLTEPEAKLRRSASLVDDQPSVLAYRHAWSLQIAASLEHLHSHDTVHRDLNPFNIFLVFDGRQWLAKVGDFGISARVADCQEGRAWTSNSLVASEYSAPEIAGAHDTPADIFSLGKTLLALFHRGAGDRRRTDEVCEAVSTGTMEGAHLHKQVQGLVVENLYRDASRRPTAKDAAQRLGSLKVIA